MSLVSSSSKPEITYRRNIPIYSTVSIVVNTSLQNMLSCIFSKSCSLRSCLEKTFPIPQGNLWGKWEPVRTVLLCIPFLGNAIAFVVTKLCIPKDPQVLKTDAQKTNPRTSKVEGASSSQGSVNQEAPKSVSKSSEAKNQKNAEKKQPSNPPKVQLLSTKNTKQTEVNKQRKPGQTKNPSNSPQVESVSMKHQKKAEAHKQPDTTATTPPNTFVNSPKPKQGQIKALVPFTKTTDRSRMPSRASLMQGVQNANIALLGFSGVYLASMMYAIHSLFSELQNYAKTQFTNIHRSQKKHIYKMQKESIQEIEQKLNDFKQSQLKKITRATENLNHTMNNLVTDLQNNGAKQFKRLEQNVHTHAKNVANGVKKDIEKAAAGYKSTATEQLKKQVDKCAADIALLIATKLSDQKKTIEEGDFRVDVTHTSNDRSWYQTVVDFGSSSLNTASSWTSLLGGYVASSGISLNGKLLDFVPNRLIGQTAQLPNITHIDPNSSNETFFGDKKIMLISGGVSLIMLYCFRNKIAYGMTSVAKTCTYVASYPFTSFCAKKGEKQLENNDNTGEGSPPLKSSDRSHALDEKNSKKQLENNDNTGEGSPPLKSSDRPHALDEKNSEKQLENNDNTGEGSPPLVSTDRSHAFEEKNNKKEENSLGSFFSNNFIENPSAKQKSLQKAAFRRLLEQVVSNSGDNQNQAAPQGEGAPPLVP